MCPYCGEDVPAGSKTCWKCGFELDGETDPAAAAANGEVPEIEERKKAPRRPQRECPKCGKSIALQAIRCNHCGVQLSKGRRNWVPLVWGAFGIVILATVVGLLYRFFSTQPVPKDPGRETPVQVTRAQLAKIYKADSDAGKRKKDEIWDERHKGKFVRWNGYVLEVTPENTLSLGDNPTADRKHPHVTLTLKDPAQIDARGLKQGKSILYSARLDRYEDGTFFLDLGVIED
ncbi:MAG: zinc ribbon domain-containing protein [Planctomycetota bacterium]